MQDYAPKFLDFLRKVESSKFDTNTTAVGTCTIQQSQRNELRKEGVAALKEDLTHLYGNIGQFDVVETKEGICIVAENPDFTFTWEIKSTIKSLDYEPFLEADMFDDAEKVKAEKKAKREKEKEEHLLEIQKKREAKLEEIQRKLNKKI